MMSKKEEKAYYRQHKSIKVWCGHCGGHKQIKLDECGMYHCQKCGQLFSIEFVYEIGYGKKYKNKKFLQLRDQLAKKIEELRITTIALNSFKKSSNINAQMYYTSKDLLQKKIVEKDLEIQNMYNQIKELEQECKKWKDRTQELFDDCDENHQKLIQDRDYYKALSETRAHDLDDHLNGVYVDYEVSLKKIEAERDDLKLKYANILEQYNKNIDGIWLLLNKDLKLKFTKKDLEIKELEEIQDDQKEK